MKLTESDIKDCLYNSDDNPAAQQTDNRQNRHGLQRETFNKKLWG